MATETILDEIMARKRVDVAQRKEQMPEELLCRHARSGLPPRDLAAALRSTDGAPRIIAEIKRASPSKGLIREAFSAVGLARELAAAGAAALSVLTEKHYFQGGLRYLRIAADNVTIPVLRKDFIFDPYQIYEARVYGADAVLLIAAALSPAAFTRLKFTADEIGMGVLAEAHNEDELGMVLDAGACIVGINSRDLRTFKTDLDLCEKLLGQIPGGVVKVAESGIHAPSDIQRLQAAGADAFLIGEDLMRARSPGRRLHKLLTASRATAAVA